MSGRIDLLWKELTNGYTDVIELNSNNSKKMISNGKLWNQLFLWNKLGYCLAVGMPPGGDQNIIKWGLI